MASFNWLGGSMSDASSWSQPDPKNPTEPGVNDDVTFLMNGALIGSLDVASATCNASLVLEGSITTAVLLVNGGTFDFASGTLSVGAQNEYITEATGQTATFSQSGGTHTINGDLAVGYGGGVGTYTLSGGELSSGAEYIGQNSIGTFTQTGGTHTVSDRIVLGINITAGALGTGTYTLGGTGSLSFQEMFIGSDPSCHGTFNFNAAVGDTATLTVGGAGGYPGLIVGGQGIGVMTQGSGSVSSTISVGFRTGGQGTYNFNDGHITSSSETVGDSGTGTLTQNGGTNDVSANDLVVGNAPGGNGAYNLHSGSLTIDTGDLTIGAQANSIGDFQFDVGASDGGTLTLTKGMITVGDGGTGSFTQGGGTLAADIVLGAQTGSEGTYTLNGGSLTASTGESVGDSGTGTFTQTDGTNEIENGNLYVGNDGVGTYTLGGSSSLTVNGGDFDLAVGGDSSGTFNFNTSAGDDATISTDSGLITVGVHGSATFTMGDGTLDVKLVVGGQVGSHGTFVLDDGTVEAAGQVVGNDGGGTFKMNGGTDDITSGGDLMLGAFAAGGGAFDLANGTLKDGGELVGYAGKGTFSQSGGMNEISGAGSLLDLGTESGAKGSYLLTSGSLSALEEIIGDAGKGTFTQNGASSKNTISGTAAKLDLGAQGAGNGAYVLDAGTLKTVLEIVGDAGTGAFTQRGKSVNTISGSGAELDIGAQKTGHGAFSLVGATLAAKIEIVGDAGMGTFTENGGSNTLSGSGSKLDVGVQSGSNGAYVLTKGALAAALEIVGGAGTGHFNQSAGANTIKGSLTIGSAGTGVYALSGGSLTVDVVAGLNDVITLAAKTGSNGTLSISNGKVTAPNIVVGAGTGAISVGTGGVLTVAQSVSLSTGSSLNSTSGDVVIGTGVKATTGTIAVGAGGSLIGAGSVTGTIVDTAHGKIEAHGGVLTLDGAVSGGGVLLIDNGATLNLDGGDANAAKFEGASGILKLDDPSAMKGGLTGMQIGDTIDFANIIVTHVKRSDHTLTVTEKGGTILTFQASGAFANTKFVIQSDGHRGDDIVLSALSSSAGISTNSTPQSAALAAIDAHLSANHEDALRPSSGDFADHSFLVVDATGAVHYESAQGMMFELHHHHGSLGAIDFV